GAPWGELSASPRREHHGLLAPRYPMEHGAVRDWSDTERVWQCGYGQEQPHTCAKEHPVLLNPGWSHKKAAEVSFEGLDAPALFISMQAVLSLQRRIPTYATGRTVGTVLDAGDGVTHAVPIYEGFAQPHSVTHVDVAGRAVSCFLRLLLREEGADSRASAEFKVLRAIKEVQGRQGWERGQLVRGDSSDTEQPRQRPPPAQVGAARLRVPERLFRPHLVGDEREGVHGLPASATHQRDPDLRQTLFANIVLSGGSRLFKGFGDQLLCEVKKLAPKDVKIQV
ncbi:ACTY protein, partial [Crypturellus soui]|nr:ACTY protein [Crypturellus soui]